MCWNHFYLKLPKTTKISKNALYSSNQNRKRHKPIQILLAELSKTPIKTTSEILKLQTEIKTTHTKDGYSNKTAGNLAFWQSQPRDSAIWYPTPACTVLPNQARWLVSFFSLNAATLNFNSYSRFIHIIWLHIFDLLFWIPQN